MKLYAGIDLHANNHVLVVSDEEDHILSQKRLRNELSEILRALTP
jgi:transposase